MADKSATLTLPDGQTVELPIHSGTVGPDVMEVAPLAKAGLFTFDPGFVATASTESKITYIDGAAGVLLHRGYTIQELAAKSDYLEVCYLLYYGYLPDAQQKLSLRTPSRTTPWFTSHYLASLMDSITTLTPWP